jgi:hypothetical protein
VAAASAKIIGVQRWEQFNHKREKECTPCPSKN